MNRCVCHNTINHNIVIYLWSTVSMLELWRSSFFFLVYNFSVFFFFKCDVCMCWQHFICVDTKGTGIPPTNYVCLACEKPKGELLNLELNKIIWITSSVCRKFKTSSICMSDYLKKQCNMQLLRIVKVVRSDVKHIFSASLISTPLDSIFCEHHSPNKDSKLNVCNTLLSF